MAYQSRQPRRTPTTREAVGAEFARADGKSETQGNYAKVIGPSPNADIAAEIIHRKVELACGCYWPEALVAGVCDTCTNEAPSPNVCKAHFVVCDCGAPCCWKHSHPTENATRRKCDRCHLHEKNKATKAAVWDGLCRAARRIFFK
ncbi:MAG: hypothetical protein H6819_07000 [Phycisphaerales bacterium]|nr:hypothetical protein [Phycisphaerales bacterium]MCB9855329.1 hypothetical protein [Phycisphaerales bacterium]MCB9862922.1 hypothetical protein [Phycisphaerales bacterium]